MVSINKEAIMGYRSKVQVILRGSNPSSASFISYVPPPLAEALEIEKGEAIEWVVQDKHTLVIRRLGASDE